MKKNDIQRPRKNTGAHVVSNELEKFFKRVCKNCNREIFWDYQICKKGWENLCVSKQEKVK